MGPRNSNTMKLGKIMYVPLTLKHAQVRINTFPSEKNTFFFVGLELWRQSRLRPSLKHQLPVRASVHIPDALLLIQLPANGLESSRGHPSEDGLSAWAPVPTRATEKKLQALGPAPANAA